MKKLISLVLCAVMLLGIVPFMPAQAETKQEAGSAVDIVLLIDQSGSVWYQDGDVSDPDGLRLDAAQMVIALLGRNGSRVAYVPFGSRVFGNADTSFHTIGSTEDYRSKMTQVEKLRDNGRGPNGENGDGTDYAEALAYAYNLLADRGPDETNQPMIILLTDGDMRFDTQDNRLKKPYYIWSPKTRRFETASASDYTWIYVDPIQNNSGAKKVLYACDLLDEVVAQCRISGYPVYTVALNADSTSEHYAELNSISGSTGAGKVFAVAKGDHSALTELPIYFGAMFAKRIGSSELTVLKPRPVPGQPNVYEVKFVIPNNSVMEANLFVAKDGIVGTPELFDADTNEPGTSSVTELSSKNFVLYKLNNPSPYGIWCLRFTAKDAEAASKISFNLLYNYDVVLHGYVSEDGYNRYEGGYTFQRGDTLVFTSQFYDNREGRLSTDPRMYDYPDDPTDPIDDWCKMNATYEIRQVTGTTSQLIESGKMMVKGTQFYIERPMWDIKKDAAGNNTLGPGEYFMAVRVEGSGLVREVVIPFTLENTPPGMVSSITLSREVDGDDPATREATPMSHPVADRIKDYDRDEVVCEFVQTSGHDVVTLTYNAATGDIISTPIRKADGKLAYGVATGELRVREADSFGDVQTVIPVTMNVRSGNDVLAQRWNPRLLLSVGGVETGSGSVQGKNSTFDIRLDMILKDNGRVDRSETVDKVVKATIVIENTVTGDLLEDTMTLGDDKTYTYTYTTGSNAGQWKVKVYTFQDGDLPLHEVELDFSVANTKPVANMAGETVHINHNALPEFLSFLGEVTVKEERTLTLTDAKYFTETDNETLTYVLQQAPNANLLTIDQANGEWVLNPVMGANGKTEFTVIAVDNDGEQTGAITFEVTLTDLVYVWTQRGLLALAALIALIILILIIREILKPKFPRAMLGVREGSSDYNTSEYELMPSKKPVSLAAVVMTDTAAKYGISANALTNIMLVPIRSTNGSIGVRLKKKMDDVTVSLTTKNVGKGKKPTVWTPGDALILNSRNNTTGSELNVYLFPTDPTTPVADGGYMSDDPFQVGDDGGFGGFNRNVDAFGANDVSGSFGGLAPTDDFGASAMPSDNGFSMPAGDDNGATDSFTSDSDSNNDFTIGF